MNNTKFFGLDQNNRLVKFGVATDSKEAGEALADSAESPKECGDMGIQINAILTVSDLYHLKAEMTTLIRNNY